jgi:hypothetical protein
MYRFSSIDSNVSLRWKQRKSKELGTFPSLQHFEGRGAYWSSGMRTRRSDKHQLLTRICINQTSCLVHSLNTFGARTSRRQTWTHKTHHSPDLGEATTFPLIVYFVPLHEAHIQMAFCLETPKWESQNSQSWGPITLCANFQLRWGLKQSCSPHWELSNSMWHAICTQGNWDDS